MDFISTDLLFRIAAGIIVLSVLIVVHELGHFLAAKICKVGVVKFSLGFGPAIFKKKVGDTIYQICPIPLGGYVRMVGDMPDMLTGEQETDEAVRIDTKKSKKSASQIEEDRHVELLHQDPSKWFIHKGFWAKSFIVFAGPFFNLILAILLVQFNVATFGEEVIEEASIIGNVQEGSPAQQAGLQRGDLVKELNGRPIAKWVELAEFIRGSAGDLVKMQIEREGSVLNIDIQPKEKILPSISGKEEKVFLVGVEPYTERKESGIVRATEVAFLWSYSISLRTYQGIWGMLSGQISPKELAGPIFILDAAGKQAKKGIEDVLYFMALLSISLAVLNLLPIPILDGGHLIFFIIEAIFGPLSVRKKEIAQTVGLLLLCTLMVYSLGNDLTREELPQSKVSWDQQE
jgi:regulator of sigma E protease